MFDTRKMAHTTHFILLTEICYCDIVCSFYIQKEIHFHIQCMRLSVLSVGQGLGPGGPSRCPPFCLSTGYLPFVVWSVHKNVGVLITCKSL